LCQLGHCIQPGIWPTYWYRWFDVTGPSSSSDELIDTATIYLIAVGGGTILFNVVHYYYFEEQRDAELYIMITAGITLAQKSCVVALPPEPLGGRTVVQNADGTYMQMG